MSEELEERMVELTEERNGLVDEVAELAAKNRSLKAQLTKVERGSSTDADAQEIFDYWHTGFEKNANTKLGPARRKMIHGALKIADGDKAFVKRSIDGLRAKPHVGPRGRSAKAYPGSQVRDDLRYALRDEQQMEDAQRWLVEAQGEAALQIERATRREVKRRLRDPVGSVKQDLIRDHGRNHDEPESPRWNGGHLEQVIARLEQAQSSVRQVKPDQWVAQCPHHDDHNPSLAIKECADGTVLLHCRAGCGTADIIQDLGLRWTDLGRPLNGFEGTPERMRQAFPEAHSA